MMLPRAFQSKVCHEEKLRVYEILSKKGYVILAYLYYNFIDSKQDITNYDFILIEYTQNDLQLSSVMLNSKSITKNQDYDIALWGYSTRFTCMNFVDNEFALTTIAGDGSWYNYLRT